MICIDSNFFEELTRFWFENKTPTSLNSHLIFAITTFIVSLILVLLNFILSITKEKDLLRLNFDETLQGWTSFKNKFYLCSLWVLGSFLISFILTTTEIINIKMISSLIVGFTWDKLFMQLNKMYGAEGNPNEIFDK